MGHLRGVMLDFGGTFTGTYSTVIITPISNIK